jgi:hypothetical protein
MALRSYSLPDSRFAQMFVLSMRSNEIGAPSQLWAMHVSRASHPSQVIIVQSTQQAFLHPRGQFLMLEDHGTMVKRSSSSEIVRGWVKDGVHCSTSCVENYAENKDSRKRKIIMKWIWMEVLWEARPIQERL